MICSQPHGGGMSSSVSCTNNAGMARNMNKADLPAPPTPWNGRCGGAAWDGFVGMRPAGCAAGKEAMSESVLRRVGYTIMYRSASFPKNVRAVPEIRAVWSCCTGMLQCGPHGVYLTCDGSPRQNPASSWKGARHIPPRRTPGTAACHRI